MGARMRSWDRGIFVGSFISICLIALSRLRTAIKQARSIPFSPLVAGWRVGPEYLERNALPTIGARAGEVNDFDVFARSIRSRFITRCVDFTNEPWSIASSIR